MSFFHSILIFLPFIISLSLSQDMTDEQYASYNEFLSDQKRLVKDLFADYDPTLTAIYTLYQSEYVNQSAKVHPPLLEMKVTMSMLKLVDVVEVEEKVTFLFDFIAQWIDIRLTWNPADYGGITHVYIPQSKLWLPEVSIADAHEVKYYKPDDVPAGAWINHTGSVGYYTSTVTSVICSLNVYRFPLDKHECGVTILFHGYYANEYRIVSGGVDVAKSLPELGNGEWQVTWIGAVQEKSNANLSDIIRFEAKFSRNPLFYITLVMIPAFLINFLSLIAIFLNLDNIPEKINVGLTNIMAMTFILIILATDLPKTKNIPLIAIYVMNGLAIMMVALAIIFMIPVLRKCEKKWKETRSSRKEEPLSRFAKFKKWLKFEFVLMFIFQIANLLNFLIIFM